MDLDFQILDLELQINNFNLKIYDCFENMEVQIHDSWNNLKSMEGQIQDFYTNPRLAPDYGFWNGKFTLTKYF